MGEEDFTRRIASGPTLLITLLAASASAQITAGVLRFKVNAAESTVTVAVAEPLSRIRGDATGKFKVVSGEARGDPNDIAGTGEASVVIDATSYTSDSRARDAAVKDQALEVTTFPVIRFDSDGVSEFQKDGPQSARLRVHGRLTLHGVTRSIELSLTARIDDRSRLIADGVYTFKLQEYRIERPTFMMGLLVTGEQATIVFHIVAEHHDHPGIR